MEKVLLLKKLESGWRINPLLIFWELFIDLSAEARKVNENKYNVIMLIRTVHSKKITLTFF